MTSAPRAIVGSIDVERISRVVNGLEMCMAPRQLARITANVKRLRGRRTYTASFVRRRVSGACSCVPGDGDVVGSAVCGGCVVVDVGLGELAGPLVAGLGVAEADVDGLGLGDRVGDALVLGLGVGVLDGDALAEGLGVGEDSVCEGIGAAAPGGSGTGAGAGVRVGRAVALRVGFLLALVGAAACGEAVVAAIVVGAPVTAGGKPAALSIAPLEPPL